ncbi:HNH endonuclease family protein [Geobacillus stearothermophilus]|uniref:HNH endonuclease n=1 Tax=Geobacillus stearothermophilus TaxID=1422 RepID=UPI000BB14B4C|nr:hypothetical protein GS458_2797 [Geobacillus stearothermophilus]
MKYQVICAKTGELYVVDVSFTDEEVEKHWKKWVPIVDEDSNDVEIKPYWDDKQIGAGVMRKNKVKVFDGIHHTTLDEYSIFVNRKTGEVYHYNNKVYKYGVKGDRIFLTKYLTGEEKMVYDGKRFLTSSGEWLRENKQTLSDKSFKGILYPKNNLRYRKIAYKNHQIITALYFGQDAIELALGEYSDYEINHRNLDNDDNRPENLEIVHKDENKEHATIFRKLIKQKIQETLSSLGVGHLANKAKKVKAS